MTVPLHPDVKVSDSQSKTVNIFDLTTSDKVTSGCSNDLSAKEKAARIALILVLTMIVVTALSLLLAEIFGLRWTMCTNPHHLDTLQKSWFHWPKLFKPDRNSYPYEDYWKTLTLAEKRQEMFRVTYGEVDLYDMYEDHKKPEMHEDIVH